MAQRIDGSGISLSEILARMSSILLTTEATREDN